MTLAESGLDALRGLSVLIQFPMPLGAGIGRVENGVVEEWIGHQL